MISPGAIRWVGGALLAGALARLFLLSAIPGNLNEKCVGLLLAKPDTQSHWRAAQGLVEGRGWSVPGWLGREDSSLPEQTPYTTFPPLFSLFLAGGLWLGGEHAALVIVSAQLLLSLFSIVLAYRFLSTAISPPAGYFGAWILALLPDAVVLSLFVLTETLFVFLLLCWLTLWVSWLRDEERWRRVIGLGVLGGLLVLCRSIADFSMWLLPLLLWAGFRRVQPRRRWLLALILFLLSSQGVVSLWRARNYFHFEHFALTARQGEHLLFNAVAVLPEAWANPSDYSTHLEVLRPRLLADCAPCDAFQADARFRREAWRIVGEHTRAYVLTHVRGSLRLLGVGPFQDLAALQGRPYRGTRATIALLRGEEGSSLVSLARAIWSEPLRAAYGLVLAGWHALVVIGLVRGWRMGGAPRGITLACLAWWLPTYLLAGPAAVYRYRFSIWPALLFLGLLGGACILSRLAARFPSAARVPDHR